MNKAYDNSIKKVVSYFNSKESRWGYSILLKGTKHFGYYPRGKENISIKEAQSRMEDLLGRKINKPKGSIILDAGSGEGNVAFYLANRYSYRIKGIDLLNFAVKKARKKAKELDLEKQVNFSVGDYAYLKFPKNTFDGIYTMEALVHVPNYKRALKEFYRVLKKGGKLVLFEYSLKDKKDIGNKEKYFRDIIIEESGMHSLPYFIHGKFPKILSEAGFKKIQVENITPRIMPLAKIFYRLAFIPYLFIKLIGKEKKYINITASIEAVPTMKKDYWRYNIISAVKE